MHRRFALAARRLVRSTNWRKSGSRRRDIFGSRSIKPKAQNPKSKMKRAKKLKNFWNAFHAGGNSRNNPRCHNVSKPFCRKHIMTTGSIASARRATARERRAIFESRRKIRPIPAAGTFPLSEIRGSAARNRSRAGSRAGHARKCRPADEHSSKQRAGISNRRARGFGEKFQRAGFARRNHFGRAVRPLPARQAAASGGRYPSLSYWLAQKNQRRELCGEELRLLYVALTRARDTLILSASISQKKWETLWTETGAITAQKILAAKSYADWLGLWFAQSCPVMRLRQKANCRICAGGLPMTRKWRAKRRSRKLKGKSNCRNLMTKRCKNFAKI